MKLNEAYNIVEGWVEIGNDEKEGYIEKSTASGTNRFGAPTVNKYEMSPSTRKAVEAIKKFLRKKGQLGLIDGAFDTKDPDININANNKTVTITPDDPRKKAVTYTFKEIGL